GQGEVVVKVRRARPSSGDDVQGLSGSTRLEAKRQRRREGRGQRRTRPQVLSESEFLARRESVVRKMVVRGKGSRIQIAVLEDELLVEHFVVRAGGQGMVGNVYLGKVQNILPSMEAAFIDIGRGRNAVLYAGEVNWDRTGLSGRTRTIEQAMNAGDSVPVQVTKDPVGHKGARLTSHIALSGRHLVYVPHGNASGISRKLPDAERRRLRSILKRLVPEGAGVIVRTAAEGAGDDDLERDIRRLQAEWAQIEAKAEKGGAPALLHSEPDLIVRVVRDVFNEDFSELIVDSDEAYKEIKEYLEGVSPDLVARLKRHVSPEDVFSAQRVDEQLLKALDRKVYLPSGGSLVIDRTEAMTVIDVNTGKFTGAGGNLEETVTRNNLEAAEEIVRQLRLRDIGGIIVIDFIDMVLESNRDLVLRRLTECLGRDRTKHQVTEITSLGLVQMTRKRVGQGLLEAFSEPCEHCKGRGVLVNTDPTDRFVKPEKSGGKSEAKSGRRKESKGKSKQSS
ncbi:MAG: Rne/Rng family ribonuclease, partial [Stackebrandtia sp.]